MPRPGRMGVVCALCCYHSLEATLDKQFSRGLSFHAAYTYSHSIDWVVDNLFNGGSASIEPNAYNVRARTEAAVISIIGTGWRSVMCTSSRKFPRWPAVRPVEHGSFTRSCATGASAVSPPSAPGDRLRSMLTITREPWRGLEAD